MENNRPKLVSLSSRLREPIALCDTAKVMIRQILMLMLMLVLMLILPLLPCIFRPRVLLMLTQIMILICYADTDTDAEKDVLLLMQFI